MEIIKQIRNINESNTINSYDIEIQCVDKLCIKCEFCTRQIFTDTYSGFCFACGHSYHNEIIEKIEEMIWNFDFDIEEKIQISNEIFDVEELFKIKILNYYGTIKYEINYNCDEINLIFKNQIKIRVQIYNKKLKRDNSIIK